MASHCHDPISLKKRFAQLHVTHNFRWRRSQAQLTGGPDGPGNRAKRNRQRHSEGRRNRQRVTGKTRFVDAFIDGRERRLVKVGDKVRLVLL